MTPAARVQAAIDLLEQIVAAARDGGAAADVLIARYFKTRRYAGSKDRRAVRDLVYDAIRRAAERPTTGRAAMVGLARERPELAALFDGSTHAPDAITDDEKGAKARVVPHWIFPLLSGLLDETERTQLLERAQLDIRVNTLKTSREAVLEQIPESSALDMAPNAIRLPEGYPVDKSPLWEDGAIEVQDAGSQLIAIACAARPGQTIIDLCAGAGGKTLALAADMQGQGTLIAADTVKARLDRLTPRAERAGADFIETLLLDQGHEATSLLAFTGRADVVLVDAPCSGTGTWRRNPEARWRLDAKRLDRLIAEQARILDLAAPLLASGGTLVYAVCSLLDKEGPDQVNAFVSRHSGWTCDSMALGAGRPWGQGVMLTPGHDGTDGFFFARMKKS